MAGARLPDAMTAVLEPHSPNVPAVDLAGHPRAGRAHDLAMRTPGDVHSALVAAGAFPFPDSMRTIGFRPDQGSAADAAKAITARDLFNATRSILEETT